MVVELACFLDQLYRHRYSFSDNREPNDYYYHRCDNGHTTPLYLLLNNWDSLLVDRTIFGSEILVGYWIIAHLRLNSSK